jgi:hypothetical protein
MLLTKAFSTLTLILIYCFACAQIEYPDLSYSSTIHQKVGFTNFRVDYERPMQRGRPIFGGLVPYGKPWKTGGGFHNRISFDTDILVDGTKIKKGTYHLVTIPDPKEWRIILTTDTLVFERNKPYEEDKEVMRISRKPEKAGRHYEAFTVDIDIVNNDAVFVFSWDYTSIRFQVHTGTTNLLMTQIRKLMTSKTATGEDYARAAEFMAFNINGLSKSAHDTVLLLAKKAMALAKDEGMEGWMLSVKADLYKSTGNLKHFEAITKERIAYIKRRPSDDSEQEINRIQGEFERYKKASSVPH